MIEKILPNERNAKSDDEVREFYERLSDRALAFHVRNQSLGPVNLDNSHPFWVTNMDWGHPYDIAMMHNGTVQGVQINGDLSDTGNIATYILRPLFAKSKSLAKALWNSEEYWFQLSAFIGTNKFVLLNNEGEFVIVNPGAGRVLEGSGIWVSGKSSLKAIAPDNKSGSYHNVSAVAATPADNKPLLSPDGVSWTSESDGRLHLHLGRDALEIGDVTDIMENIEAQARRLISAG